MNKRILTVVATMTLLCLTSGCGVMRQFWFGRGARCGNQAVAPIRPLANLRDRLHGNAVAPPQAPCNCNPYLGGQPIGGIEHGCGLERGCGWERGCGLEHGCGVESYGGVINDPYLSGSVVGDGVVIDGTTMPGTVLPDNFVPAESRSYKVDTDGARILSEAPLPPGATPVN